MSQLGFYVDTRYCIACKTCQIACKDKNNLRVGQLFRHVTTFEGGKFPNPWIYHVSMSCNHCADPPCVANCPTGALYKRESDGLVLQDKDKCIGCRYCMWSCPYDAISFNEEEGTIGKCDACEDLLAQGQEPACVASCNMRVLHFGDLEALRQQYGGTSDILGLPDSDITHPSLLLTPKPVAVKVGGEK
jgi:anaerobic dimethyl sulfoxide reductase subunit B (iron-sulfur subunit)